MMVEVKVKWKSSWHGSLAFSFIHLYCVQAHSLWDGTIHITAAFSSQCCQQTPPDTTKGALIEHVGQKGSRYFRGFPLISELFSIQLFSPGYISYAAFVFDFDFWFL